MNLFRIISLFIFTHIQAFSGGTAENVLLVVNADSIDSKTVANHYTKLRNIPREQIIYLSGIDPVSTYTNSYELRKTILEPIYKHLKESKQEEHIDYIIYSTGFPYGVKCAGDAPKGKTFAATQNPILSLTSATFYADIILKKEMNYLESGANPLYNISEKPQSFRTATELKKNNIHYRLSFQFGNLSPNSSSTDQILSYLQSAKDADFTQPKGTFYFTETADVRSRTRLAQFALTAENLIKLGYNAEIIKTGTPMQKSDILGATIGIRAFDWVATKSTFIPGAIGDNFTSYGGVLTGKSGQTPCTQFLNNGAAASCGTVVEPYAIAAKFPHANMHLHYAQGANAAEAMYASVKAPYQLIMMGDALCQPFAKPYAIEVTSSLITADGSKQVAYTPTTNRPAAHYEVFIDGVFREKVKEKFLLGIDDLAPGAHELRIVAVADDTLETRVSHTKRIFLTKNMPRLKISATQNSIKLGETLAVKVTSQGLPEISLYQNTQLLGKTKNGTLKIKAETLGLGKNEIYGIVEKDGRKVRTAQTCKIICYIEI